MTNARVTCKWCNHLTIFANLTADEADGRTITCPNCKMEIVMHKTGTVDLEGDPGE